MRDRMLLRPFFLWRLFFAACLLAPALAFGGYFTVGGTNVFSALTVGDLKVNSTSTQTGAVSMAGTLSVTGGATLASTLDARGAIRNSGALAPVLTDDSDGMKFSGTSGPWILGSDTSATGGTDVAVVIRANSLTATGVDRIVEFRDSTNAVKGYVLDNGSVNFNEMTASGQISCANATVGNTLLVSTNVRVGGAASTYNYGHNHGTITLSAGSGTATINAGPPAPICVCTDTTAANAVKCSTSGSTLTATGTGSDVIAYHCLN